VYPDPVAGISQLALLFQLLDPVHPGQEVPQRTGAVGLGRVLGLMVAEPLDAVGLVDPFGCVVGEYAVEVEGDPKVAIGGVVGNRREEHLTRRVALLHRLADVDGVRGQEQRHVERLHEPVRRAALHEDRSGDAQPVRGDRPHDPTAGVGIVAGQHHHLDRRVVRRAQVVEGEQPPDEPERHPGGQLVVDVLLLVPAVGLLALAPKHGVGFGQVEQRAGRNAEDQPVLQVVRHVWPFWLPLT